MDKFRKLLKELDKTLQEYKSNNSPEEEKAYNAGRIDGLKSAMEIIDRAFQAASR